MVFNHSPDVVRVLYAFGYDELLFLKNSFAEGVKGDSALLVFVIDFIFVIARHRYLFAVFDSETHAVCKVCMMIAFNGFGDVRFAKTLRHEGEFLYPIVINVHGYTLLLFHVFESVTDRGTGNSSEVRGAQLPSLIDVDEIGNIEDNCMVVGSDIIRTIFSAEIIFDRAEIRVVRW